VRKVPFTILSGWLGTGKTTALNRMLAAQTGPNPKKIAVLVNELGRISIDTQLIIGRGGDVLELAGGCVCCKVDTKNDLWDGIGDIIARSEPDHVVLETTGIAEPAAILEGLHRVPEAVRERVLPAGVVCVVDAETGAKALRDREEALLQAQSADRILISKLDVASADAVRATHAILDEVAPEAERAAFPADQGRAMTAWIVEPRKLRAWTTHAHDHEAHRQGQLVAVAFRDSAPLVGERVMAYVDSLGDRLVRAKGFVHLAGDPRRGFVEKAGARTSMTYDAWPGAPVTELVLIGELDEGEVLRALWATSSAPT
jgi:G3E family GTPase